MTGPSPQWKRRNPAAHPLKPVDPAQVLEMLRKGRKVTGIVSSLKIGAQRAAEIRAIGEAAGLVHDPETRTMAAPEPATISLVPAVIDLGPALGVTAEDLAWQDDGLCAETDPEAFFPEKGGSARQAKAVCRACPVRAECLDYALEHDERFGIWGGLSERERRRLKRQVAA